MLKLLEGIGKWVGIVTAVTTVIGFVYGLFRDPIYIAAALVVVSLSLIALSVEVWWRKEDVQGRVHVDGGSAVRREYAYGKTTRWGVCVAAVLMVIGTTRYSASHFDGFFALSEMYNGAWVGGGKKAVNLDNGKEYDFARLMKPDDDPAAFGIDTCAVKFDLWKKDLVQWVRLDGIRIIVHEYKPIAGRISVTMSYGGLVETNTFLAEIDSHKGQYLAMDRYELSPTDGKVRKGKMGTVYLEKERPDPFFVRINAKIAGIYTISCEVDVSHRDRRRTIQIVGPHDFFFGEGDSGKAKAFPGKK